MGRATIGENHARYASRLNNLALVHSYLAQNEEAQEQFRQAIIVSRAALGEDHPELGIVTVNMAELQRRMNLFDEAILHADNAHRVFLRALGKDHPHTEGCWQFLQRMKRALRAR